MKTSLDGFNSTFKQKEEELANLKIGQLKLLSLRTKRMKNSEENLRDVWDTICTHYTYDIQYTHYWISKG